MFARACRATGAIAALLCAHCGYVGIELTDPIDGGTASDTGVAVEIDARLQDARSVDDLDARSEDAEAGTGPEDSALEDASRDAEAIGADAAVDAQADDATTPDASDDAVVDAGPTQCDLTGDWVAKLTVSVSWPATAGTLAGAGLGSLWMRYQASADGGIIAGSRAACGVTLPSTTSIPALGGESYQPVFADAFFDALPARVIGTNGSVSINGTGVPGDTVTMGSTAYVFGTALADPVMGAWPAVGALAANDQDMDGAPGVTLGFTGAEPLIGVGVRADQAYVAARFAFQSTLTVLTCDQMQGTSAVSRFDTHFVGCHVQGGGACSTAQRDLFDSNRPIYTVNAGNMAARKIAGATCARSVLP
jgi:hypothetical protein